jgi:hypothetical protein
MVLAGLPEARAGRHRGQPDPHRHPDAQHGIEVLYRAMNQHTGGGSEDLLVPARRLGDRAARSPREAPGTATDLLDAAAVCISVYRKGRRIDNVFIE